MVNKQQGERGPALSNQPVLKSKSVTAAVTLLGVVVACAAVIAIFTVHNSLEVPKIERPKEVAWLAQNWTEDQRHRYYHLAQGSELLPYAWFLALEQPRFTITGAPPFKDDSYLQGFGFIPDSAYEQNPDGLPVGFAKDDRFVDPYTGQITVVLGITCAACHTGELFYGGKAIRLEAGPSLIDLQKFTEAIGLAVTWTYYDPVRFHRFANRVLGPNHPHADEALLCKSLKYYLDTSFAEVKATRHLFPTPEGYGRTDALARIGNFVFGTELNNKKNLVVGDGPVNFPPIWDASWMDWVQYNGSIQQPMGRNVGEALGVRSRINLLGYPGVQLQNTIHVENLHEIEMLLGGSEPGKGVWSPKWPADILGKIDLDKAAKGEKLYNELCLHCHQPPMLSDDGRKPEHWTSNTNSEGRQFFKVTMIPLAEIGTDPKEAENFANRTADSGPLGKGVVSARDGLKYITQQVIDQAYAKLKLSPEQQEEWNGYRTNELRTPLAYKARPHNGIWATPPYLHNGSVPNLFALLSPVSERPKIFSLGNKQYDPVKLGLNTDPLKGATEFRTDLPGNSNSGHEFNDGPKGNGVIGRKLSEEERMQIIEYLKTL
jgi:mono/diheme cytochrome c family protein